MAKKCNKLGQSKLIALNEHIYLRRSVDKTISSGIRQFVPRRIDFVFFAEMNTFFAFYLEKIIFLIFLPNIFLNLLVFMNNEIETY